ncbi:MAG: hypothetical protein IT236_07435 [Bacteroidia bacterium]|nr:hypothetical protein [Bacteroidia bacterium]
MIFRKGLFGIAVDSAISKKQFAILFFLKALAVPAFYFVYKKMYGGIDQLDAGKFYHDASVIGHYAFTDPTAYLRLLFGFQNDAEGSADYVNFLQYTHNWDNGEFKDYMYNDNRVVIRIHSLFYFLSFGSYFAQALLNCLLSYIGIVFIYKSLKEFFTGREKWVLLVLCLFPALWFYTGAVLKEGIAIFIIGCQVYCFKAVIYSGASALKKAVSLLFFIGAFFLKPYLLLFSMLCFALFFYLHHHTKIKRKAFAFFGFMLVAFALVNVASMLVKHKTVFKAVESHQRVFADVAEGGIFLESNDLFIRLKSDFNLVKKHPTNDSLFSIQFHAPYMYWKNTNMADTLYCTANLDTLTQYKLRYLISHSNSNLTVGNSGDGVAVILFHALYNSLFYPLFYTAKGPLQWLASFENLLILISLLLIVITFLIRKKLDLLPLVFIFLALFICLLAGIATPNSGAIFRYRSPAVIYILLAAVYSFPYLMSKKK